jgi:hypothetical protein
MSILVFGLVLRCVLLRSPGARRAVRPLAPGSFLPSIFQLAKQGEPRDLSLPNPVYRQRLATDIRFLLLVALSIFCSRERIHFLARQVRWRHPWPLIFILNVWLLGFDARSPRQLSWLGSSDHCCRFSSVELTGGFSKIDFLCMI